MKTALTIAGSDCSGGAGIQADIKTMSALGVYAMSVLTSVVAENTGRVISQMQVPIDMISDQLDAVFEDIKVNAVKIGMISSAPIMRLVAQKLRRYRPSNVIVDPVMYAKDGTPLMREDSKSEFLHNILPLATILTPNIPEAEAITGVKITTIDDMKRAAAQITSMGSKSVLVKGGHYNGEATDVFYDGTYTLFSHERIQTKNTHGTGCTLSSAIAAFLAKGFKPTEAVKNAKEFITEAIRHSLSLGHGNGPLNPFFANMGDKKKVDLTLYLVTDRRFGGDLISVIEAAIRGGVTIIQLREKVLGGEFFDIAKQVRELTLRYDVPLIINDRVDIALAVNADGVHVGQSDLPCPAVRKLVGDRMIIGVTAHSVEEAIRAENDGADYIGVGAMAKTGTKDDAKLLATGELERIRRAVKIPIVIIGGINAKNVSSFTEYGVDGIAVSSAIMHSADPQVAARELRSLWQK